MKKFLKIFLIFILLVFLIKILVVFFLISKYKTWEGDFESNIFQENLISGDGDISVNIQERITTFTLSSENTDSLTLTPSEVGRILYSTLDGYLGDVVKVESVYVYPQQGVWNVYVEIKYWKYSIWFSMDIIKDNMQTVQIYTKNILIGPYSIGNMFNLTDMINEGIANSLLTVNENGFSGRYLENLELMPDSIVLKGSRY